MASPWVGLGLALVVALGGAAGAVVRHLLASGPLGGLRGVLLANTTGAALLGVLTALVKEPWLMLLMGTGVCGALTTWSTLVVQTLGLWERSPWRATAYLLLNVLLGLGAALLALRLLT